MKTIVIFCRNISPDVQPFHSPYYVEAYQDFLLVLKSKGVNAYLATGQDTYLGKGKFSRAFTITEKVDSCTKFTEVGEVTADMVYDKGGFEADDITVLNPPFVRDIATSKLETFKHFGEYQPRSFACENEDELKKALQSLAPDGGLVVAKEVVSSSGHHVYIGPRDEVFEKARHATYPLITQEFVDTSAGIPGHITGMHDLRVILGGGRVFGGRLRWPRPGDYRANVAQGGGERYLMAKDIPKEVIALATEIGAYFQGHPHYIAIDFALTPNGWKLIELNDKPGFTPLRIGPAAAHVYDCLANYLIELST